MPTTCVCGAAITVDHAMTSPSGGYPTAQHIEVRDVVADAMCSVFADVETEPKLLSYTEEDLLGKMTNRAKEARVDIRANGFWTRQQEAFFGIRIMHPKANLSTLDDVKKQLTAHEREKKRSHAERINVIDCGVFTPLVFTTNGMIGHECSTCLKSLVASIVEKNVDLSYSQVMHHLRCKLSFCLLRWGITCLRGCRASFRRSHWSDFLNECRLVSGM